MEILANYQSSILALGAVAALMFIQLIIADVVGIKSKHIPGSSIPSDHKLLLFRASRTVANTNESIGIFIIAFAFAMLSDVTPSLHSACAWSFFGFRSIYAVFYYFDFRLLRSISFVLILISLIVLIVSGVAQGFS